MTQSIFTVLIGLLLSAAVPAQDWRTTSALRYAPPPLVNPIEVAEPLVFGRPGTGVTEQYNSSDEESSSPNNEPLGPRAEIRVWPVWQDVMIDKNGSACFGYNNGRLSVVRLIDGRNWIVKGVDFTAQATVHGRGFGKLNPQQTGEMWVEGCTMDGRYGWEDDFFFVQPSNRTTWEQRPDVYLVGSFSRGAHGTNRERLMSTNGNYKNGSELCITNGMPVIRANRTADGILTLELGINHTLNKSAYPGFHVAGLSIPNSSGTWPVLDYPASNQVRVKTNASGLRVTADQDGVAQGLAAMVCITSITIAGKNTTIDFAGPHHAEGAEWVKCLIHNSGIADLTFDDWPIIEKPNATRLVLNTTSSKIMDRNPGPPPTGLAHAIIISNRAGNHADQLYQRHVTSNVGKVLINKCTAVESGYDAMIAGQSFKDKTGEEYLEVSQVDIVQEYMFAAHDNSNTALHLSTLDPNSTVTHDENDGNTAHNAFGPDFWFDSSTRRNDNTRLPGQDASPKNKLLSIFPTSGNINKQKLITNFSLDDSYSPARWTLRWTSDNINITGPLHIGRPPSGSFARLNNTGKNYSQRAYTGVIDGHIPTGIAFNIGLSNSGMVKGNLAPNSTANSTVGWVDVVGKARGFIYDVTIINGTEFSLRGARMVTTRPLQAGDYNIVLRATVRSTGVSITRSKVIRIGGSILIEDNPSLSNIVKPKILGIPTVGTLLTHFPGNWSLPNVTFFKRWYKNSTTKISEASSYRVKDVDVNQDITLVVEATDGVETSTATSDPVRASA